MLGCRALLLLCRGGAGGKAEDDKVAEIGPVLEGRGLEYPVSFPLSCRQQRMHHFLFFFPFISDKEVTFDDILGNV